MELTDKPNPNGVKTDPKAFEIAKQLINAGKNWGKGGDNIDMYSGAELIRDFAEQYAQEKVKELEDELNELKFDMSIQNKDNSQ